MKLSGIHYTPKALVRFTLRELELVRFCAERHYDGVCRDAGQERLTAKGNHPGLVAGLCNATRSAGEEYEHSLTFRDMDTMAKCLEVAHTLLDAGSPDYKTARELARSLSEALTRLNNEALEDKRYD